jgi:hypothetical protein
MEGKLSIWHIVSWLFGIAVFFNGILNVNWGNDFGLGVAFIFLSFIYVPPINTRIKNRIGISIPAWVKIILALAIIWITGAVGAIAEGYVF